MKYIVEVAKTYPAGDRNISSKSYYELYDALTVARIEAKQLENVEHVEDNHYYSGEDKGDGQTVWICVMDSYGQLMTLWRPDN